MMHDLIRNRRSPVGFSKKPVEQEKINEIFEAARWAASSFNEQPWRFIYGTRGTETFDKLYQTLMPGNQSWNERVPVLILTVAKTHFSHNDKPNRHAFHDVGLAAGNLSIQATALNLFTHQMGGFNKEKARELFHIPDGFEPVAMIALGYLADPDEVPEELKSRDNKERKRKPLKEIVYTETWPD